MKINNLTNTSFNGIYFLKTPLSSQEFEEKIRKPYIEYTDGVDVFEFKGRRPMDVVVQECVENFLKENEVSRFWLEQNAKNHGFDITTPDNDLMTVITLDDLGEMASVFHSGRKGFMLFIDNVLHKLFGIGLDGLIYAEEHPDTPEEMLDFYSACNYYKTINDKFAVYSKDRIVDVERPEELLDMIKEEYDRILDEDDDIDDSDNFNTDKYGNILGEIEELQNK